MFGIIKSFKGGLVRKTLVVLLALSFVLNLFFLWRFLEDEFYLVGYTTGQKEAQVAIMTEITRQYQTGQLKFVLDGKEIFFTQKK